MIDSDGKRVGLTGIDWEQVKRTARDKKSNRVAVAEGKLGTINTAIRKLIIIKKRRMNEGAPSKNIRACQIEIDKLMQLKRDVITATKFIEWRKKNA